MTEAERIAELAKKIKPTLRDELAVVQPRIARALAGKSESYVEDARYFAVIARDYVELRLALAQTSEQLGVVQERCTELLIENRRLRGLE